MGVSQRVNAALTDLNAYVLTLDLERLRLDNRLRELAKNDSATEDWHPLLRERDELGEELAALRAAIGALREQISP
jgi:ABC-type phosphate transport system auxiliary subunit